MTRVLEIAGLSKAYPGVIANDDVSFAIGAGEIHALLGENGAGKSTLVKMVYGLVRPDAGTMRLKGQPYTPSEPRAARAAGVAMVFQHFSLFEALSVAENVALGMENPPPIRDLAARIAEVSAATGTPVLVGHHRRHNPLVAKAKEIVDSAALGAITTVHGNCWLPKPDSYYEQGWRQESGAGPLFINLIHDVDVLMYLCGPITHVQALEANTQRQAQAEEVVVATLRFANGALGTLNLSDTALAPWSWELTAGENPAYPKTDQNSYLIGGTHGALALPNLALWSQENGPDWWAPISATRYPVDNVDTLVAQLTHFGDVIRGKAAPRVSATDGLRAVAVVEAIKRAAHSGGTIALE